MHDSPSEALLAAARAGDKHAFGALIEPHRGELLVHCYRMLGSLQDAEDMVQETLLRAWNHLGTFTGGVYFRAWLYKIATNLCLDALDKRQRRVLASSSFPVSAPRSSIAPPISEPIWLEPFPDALLPETAINPEARYTQRESITLAFLAALQRLPPRQRVILVLCDVLDWHTKEAAQLLEITVAAANGLLRRARSTMHNSYDENSAGLSIDKALRPILAQYVEAWETGDVDTLIALLADKAIFTMPPSPTWFCGQEAIRPHAMMMFAGDAARWRMRQTQANQRAAFGCYRRDAENDVYHAYALQVITLDEAHITEMQMFLIPTLFPHFGLAMTLLAEDV